jgi:tripartite-type tricarboxylate transporter receptor subunit TctC
VLSAIKSGQLKALAVSSKARLDLLPDVPTVEQSGYKNFEADQWYGVVAPAGTPAPVISILNASINKALNSNEFKARLNSEGAFAKATSPREFGTHIASEIKRWKPVISSGRVKAD